MGDIMSQFEVTETSIVVPKSLIEMSATNAHVFALLANALKETNEYTVDEFSKFKVNWINKN